MKGTDTTCRNEKFTSLPCSGSTAIQLRRKPGFRYEHAQFEVVVDGMSVSTIVSGQDKIVELDPGEHRIFVRVGLVKSKEYLLMPSKIGPTVLECGVKSLLLRTLVLRMQLALVGAAGFAVAMLAICVAQECIESLHVGFLATVIGCIGIGIALHFWETPSPDPVLYVRQVTPNA